MGELLKIINDVEMNIMKGQNSGFENEEYKTDSMCRDQEMTICPIRKILNPPIGCCVLLGRKLIKVLSWIKSKKMPLIRGEILRQIGD